MRKAMQAEKMRYLRSLGYTSDVFPAKYRGGKCGLSGKSIPFGADVAYFRDKGLCLDLAIRDVLDAERREKAPKCGCGRVADVEYLDGVLQACCLCSWIADTYYGTFYVDVTREMMPLAEAVAHEATAE